MPRITESVFRMTMNWDLPSEEELNEMLLGLKPEEVEAVVKLYGLELEHRVVTPWPGPHSDDGSYDARRVTCYIDREMNVMRVVYG